MAPLRIWKRKRDDKEEGLNDENKVRYARRLASWERFTGILDKKGRLQFASREALTQLGHAQEQAIGLPFWETVWFTGSLQSQKVVEDSVQRALGGETVQWEAEVFASDGMSFPVVFNAVKLMGWERDVVCISADPKALAEIRITAQEAEESEERFRSLLGLVHEGYFMVDKEDRITVVSSAAVEALGYDSPQELLGRSMAEIWVDQEELAQLEHWLSEGERVEEYRASLRKKDGGALRVEIAAHLLFDRTGETVGMEGVFGDVTQEAAPPVEVGQEPKPDASDFKAMSELVKDFYFRADKNGVITVASPAGARIFGYGSAEELIGLNTGDLWISGDERRQFLDELERKGKAVGWRGVFRRNDGEQAVVEIDCHVLRDVQGNLVATQGVFRDISERVRHEEELERANAELERAKTEIEQLMDEKVRRLVESEDRYFSLMERANDGVILVQDSVVKFANNAFARMAGYDTVELTDMDFSKILAPDSVPIATERYRRLMAGEEDIDVCEMELLRKDRGTLRVEVNSSLVEHDGRSADLIIMRDLSYRKRAERPVEQLMVKPDSLPNPEAVEKPRAEEPVVDTGDLAAGDLESIYWFVTENASDAVVVVRGDNLQEIVFANKRAIELSGYPEEEVRRRVAEEGAAFWFNLMGPSNPAVLQKLAESFKTSKALKTGQIPWFEVDLLRGDGKIQPLELGMSAVQIGGELCYLVIYRDVTAKRQAEAERRESEVRYKAIFDRSIEMIFICDLEGRISNANDYALGVLGYRREECAGKSYFDLVSSEDVSKAKEAFAQVVEKKASANPVGYRLVAKSGELVWIDYVGTLLERGGKASAILAIARNVTERMMWEETLEQSEQRLRDAMKKLKVSHEELSVPVVQVWENILALPLIGIMDDVRAQRVMEILLTRIVQTQSELVILDVTGVDTIDTHVTDHLLKTVRSCSLLGAQCVVTGINPEMAQTVMAIGWDTRQFVIRRDIQDGLKWALRNMGYELRNGHQAKVAQRS